LFPGLEIVITPPHAHVVVHPACSAGCPSTMTLVAPGVHGAEVTGMHGAGVNAPNFAAVAAATVGLDIVPHIPNVGMFTIGANAWMLAAGVSHVTGVPMGTTASGTGTGGIANEHVIIAPLLTRGGIGGDSTPAAAEIQSSDPADAAGRE
jgi:hypothetical protein